MPDFTTERISVRVPVDLIESFGIAAASTGRGFSEEVRLAMQDRIATISNEQRPGGRRGAEPLSRDGEGAHGGP